MNNQSTDTAPKTLKKTYLIIALIGVFSLGFRLLLEYNFHTSALLYVGFPFGIGLALLTFTHDTESLDWKARYWRHTRSALIVMLCSSIILFEGFLCVLLFMPIYLGVIFIVFLIELISRSFAKNDRSTFPVHLLPILVVISSVEGVTPTLSFDRYNEVSYSKIVDLSVDQLKNNLRKPINLGEQMPGFLSLFPMPYAVKAETLKQGDIHRSHFRYHRWFFTNTHEGAMDVELTEVADTHIRTTIVKDTSYIANYLTLHGTSIEFEPISATQTRVILTISYDRKLDPAWYFGPLERFGVKQTAGYLIDQVIYRQGESTHG